MTATTRPEVEELLEIVGNLPVSHVEEVLDFARFLEWRSQRNYTAPEAETEDAFDAENDAWDALFATEQSQRLLSRLAAQAIKNDDAGETVELVFDADGNLLD